MPDTGEFIPPPMGKDTDVLSRIEFLQSQISRLQAQLAGIALPSPPEPIDLSPFVLKDDRRLEDARRPLRHGEGSHAGYIGEERNLKFDINTGHDHDGTDSKLISVPAAFQCSDLGACSIAALGTKEHDLLGGLADDDHTLYALADKTRPAVWVSAADLAARSIADLGTKSHTLLSDIGVKTHPQIDAYMKIKSNVSARNYVIVQGWTSRSASEASSWFSVAWSPELGIFVAVALAGTNQVMSTTTWENYKGRF